MCEGYARRAWVRVKCVARGVAGLKSTRVWCLCFLAWRTRVKHAGPVRVTQSTTHVVAIVVAVPRRCQVL